MCAYPAAVHAHTAYDLHGSVFNAELHYPETFLICAADIKVPAQPHLIPVFAV